MKQRVLSCNCCFPLHTGQGKSIKVKCLPQIGPSVVCAKHTFVYILYTSVHRHPPKYSTNVRLAPQVSLFKCINFHRRRLPFQLFSGFFSLPCTRKTRTSVKPLSGSLAARKRRLVVSVESCSEMKSCNQILNQRAVLGNRVNNLHFTHFPKSSSNNRNEEISKQGL